MPYNTATGQSYSNVYDAWNAPQTFSKPQSKWTSGGVMPSQQQGINWSPGIAKTHMQGADGKWYDPKSGYTNAPPPSGFSPVGYGGSGGGGGTSSMGSGGRTGGGGGGGAPQGPFGQFMTGTPDTLEQGREMMYAGTLDPLMGFYQNAGGFQDMLRREVDIASGKDRVDYDPMRAEAADQAARASQLQGQRGRMQANRAGLNYGAGQQYQATAPMREAYGKSMRDIGYQESRDQRAMEQAANRQVASLWGGMGGHATGVAQMKQNQLNMLEDTSGMPAGLFGTQRGTSYGSNFNTGGPGLKGPQSQNMQAQQSKSYLMGQEGMAAGQYAYGKSQGWWS